MKSGHDCAGIVLVRGTDDPESVTLLGTHGGRNNSRVSTSHRVLTTVLHEPIVGTTHGGISRNGGVANLHQLLHSILIACSCAVEQVSGFFLDVVHSDTLST